LGWVCALGIRDGEAFETLWNVPTWELRLLEGRSGLGVERGSLDVETTVLVVVNRRVGLFVSEVERDPLADLVVVDP
jgi:hypothetical protein